MTRQKGSAALTRLNAAQASESVMYSYVCGVLSVGASCARCARGQENLQRSGATIDYYTEWQRMKMFAKRWRCESVVIGWPADDKFACASHGFAIQRR